MSKPLVLFHDGCADGFCAAWIARRALPDADFLPVQYGQEPPDVRDRKVYILDFSYKRPVLEVMSQQAEAVFVLDHHKTAEADLKAIGADPISGYLAGGKTLLCIFNVDKSGGRLTWEFFFPGQQAPWLVDYTEDRDLWRWKLPHSREVSAALTSLPKDFAVWDDLGQRFDPATDLSQVMVTQGRAILRYQQQLVDAAVAAAVEINLDGHKVLAVNSTVLISEIAGKLAENRPFGACFFIRGDGRKVWSFRSREGGLDVSEIAKAHGGGGHRNAAGWTE